MARGRRGPWEQFLSDVWWGQPDVLVIDLPPGTGDMTITVVQALPDAHMLVVTTPQPSASDIAVRAGLVSLQLPVKVGGVIENMSWYDHAGERLHIFGQGEARCVSGQLTRDVGYDVPLLAQLPWIEYPCNRGGRASCRPQRGWFWLMPGSRSSSNILLTSLWVPEAMRKQGTIAEGSHGKGKGW